MLPTCKSPGALPTIEQANGLMMALGCTSVENLGPKHPTTLVVGVPHDIAHVGAISNWVAKASPQLKRVGGLFFDNASGRGEVESWKVVIPAAGLQLVTTEFLPPEGKDFGPLIMRLLGQKPDIVIMAGAPSVSPPVSLAIAKALTEQNFKGPFLGAFANTDLPQAGPVVEGFVAPIPMDPTAAVIPVPARDFYNRFIEKFGAGGADIGNITYTSLAAQVLFQAMAKAGTMDDAAKIAEALRSNQWDTTVGKVGFGGAKTFGGPAVLEPPIFLSKIQGGKFVTFEVQPGPVP